MTRDARIDPLQYTVHHMALASRTGRAHPTPPTKSPFLVCRDNGTVGRRAGNTGWLGVPGLWFVE